MNWPKYYCPVSARLGTEESLFALCANDEPCRPFQPILGDEEGKKMALTYAMAERYAGAWYAKDSTIMGADPALSDACFAAFPLSSSHCLLISWQAFPDAAISGIWTELANALMDPTFTGIRKAAIPRNRVVVLLGYLPQWSYVSREGQHGNLIATLKIMHKSGYVHGGINERWLNPESPRRIFGLGLSSAYAAWRATQEIKLRGLRGDPRYACAEELLGEESCPDFDLRALGGTLIASLSCINDERKDVPWKRNVNGPSALLARIANRDGYKEYSKNTRELVSARRLLFARIHETLPPAGGDGGTEVNLDPASEVAKIVDHPGSDFPREDAPDQGLDQGQKLKAELTPNLPIIFAMVVGLILGGFMTASVTYVFGNDGKACLDSDLFAEEDKAATVAAPLAARPPRGAPPQVGQLPSSPAAPKAVAPDPTPTKQQAPAPASEYTLRLTGAADAWNAERAVLKEQLRAWLPSGLIQARFEHRNKALGKAQVRIIQRIEKLCADIDPECADKKGNKIRWQGAAMDSDGAARGLVARITFRRVSE